MSVECWVQPVTQNAPPGALVSLLQIGKGNGTINCPSDTILALELRRTLTGQSGSYITLTSWGSTCVTGPFLSGAFIPDQALSHIGMLSPYLSPSELTDGPIGPEL